MRHALVHEGLATDAIECAIWSLWYRCIRTAREADYAPADAVERLIAESRKIIAEAGSADEIDYILLGVLTNIHWDCERPTDRVFETMLAFELEGFFKERMN